jgi:hypothetical protein
MYGTPMELSGLGIEGEAATAEYAAFMLHHIEVLRRGIEIGFELGLIVVNGQASRLV